jgi:hypothetical protein
MMRSRDKRSASLVRDDRNRDDGPMVLLKLLALVCPSSFFSEHYHFLLPFLLSSSTDLLLVDSVNGRVAFDIPYWSRYAEDVERVLEEAMQYLGKYLEEAKRGRSSDSNMLLKARRVIEFYKAEFKNLDPCLWEKEGLKL